MSHGPPEVKPSSEEPTMSPVHRVILLTGFRPFRGRKANVSGDIARALDGLERDGVKVQAMVMNVEWRTGTPPTRTTGRI